MRRSLTAFAIVAATLTASIAPGSAQTTTLSASTSAAVPPATTTPPAPTTPVKPTAPLHTKVFEAKTGSTPKQVAFTPDGTELWVTLLGSRGVQVFDATTGALKGTITLGTKGGAVEVIFTKDGTRAYVSQMETASVYEIDRVRRTVLRRFATGGNWTKILHLSNDEKTLYAANWVSNDISVIDVPTGRLLKKIKTVRTPRGLATDPSETRMFVAGFEGGEIQRISLWTGETAILLRTGGAMRHMVVDPRTNRLYADDMGTDMTYTLDLLTEKVTNLAKTDSHPNTIDLSASGRFLYVSNRGQNGAVYTQPGPEWGSVVVIDTTNGAYVDALVAGNQTTGLDVSPDGKFLAYTDFMDNRLMVMAIPSDEALLAGNGGFSGLHKSLLRKRKK